MPLFKQILKLMRLSLQSFSILALLSFASCGTPSTPVDVPNVTLYFQKGDPLLPASYPDYILEEHFLTAGQSTLTKEDWDTISPGKVAMSLPDWDLINKMVSNFCSQMSCDYQTSSNMKYNLADQFNQITAHFHQAAGQ